MNAIRNNHINIISFDVPYPPDYGGVIDVFNRIKQLNKIGFSVILHCFDYNNRIDKESLRMLKQYCTKVYIYKRKKSLFFLLSSLPFIVISRRNKKLLNNLLKNDFPILFEGIHTTVFLSHPALETRFKVLRTHNIEQDYYKNLAKSSSGFFKKFFYLLESWKLKRYEPKILPFAEKILTVSDADKHFFEKLNPKTITLIPLVDSEKKLIFPQAEKKFILFHGNLSVEENEKAAIFLIKKVLSKIDVSVVIAGKNPSLRLQKAVSKFPYIRLVSSPKENEMQDLIAAAHIHILYSFQSTGIKLKLMNVLQNGKFCIANNLIVGDLPVSGLLTPANSPDEILLAIKNLFSEDFHSEITRNRLLFLSELQQKNEKILKEVLRISNEIVF